MRTCRQVAAETQAVAAAFADTDSAFAVSAGLDNGSAGSSDEVCMRVLCLSLVRKRRPR